MDQAGVPADEAETGPHGQRLFHERRGVHCDASADGRILPLQLAEEGLQAAADHAVVILAPGEAGDPQGARRRFAGVGEAADHDGAAPVEPTGRLPPDVAVSGQPVHAGMTAGGHPFPPAPVRLVQRVERGGAHQRDSRGGSGRADARPVGVGSGHGGVPAVAAKRGW